MKFTKGIYILLGSNLGDRLQVLYDTQKLIDETTSNVVRASAVYKTEPWGVSDQPAFYNQVLQLETSLDPHALLVSLQNIEKKIGKIKLGKWRERLIDIDILYYDQLVVEDKDLVLPHPEIQNRRFTLVPLCEVSPDFVHPVFQKTQQQLLASCPDQLGVWPLVNMLA